MWTVLFNWPVFLNMYISHIFLSLLSVTWSGGPKPCMWCHTEVDTTSPNFLKDLSSALKARNVGILLANTIMQLGTKHIWPPIDLDSWTHIYIYKPSKNMYLPSTPKKSPSLPRNGITSPAFPFITSPNAAGVVILFWWQLNYRCAAYGLFMRVGLKIN